MLEELHGQELYDNLKPTVKIEGLESINPSYLVNFRYEYCPQEIDIVIQSEEFTALCPWTGLPDYGELTIRYIPNQYCIELKSLKFYLLTYRDVGIVQEHAASRILADLVDLVCPHCMEITLDYKIRGGVHTVVKAKHETSGHEVI